MTGKGGQLSTLFQTCVQHQWEWIQDWPLSNHLSQQYLSTVLPEAENGLPCRGGLQQGFSSCLIPNIHSASAKMEGICYLYVSLICMCFDTTSDTTESHFLHKPLTLAQDGGLSLNELLNTFVLFSLFQYSHQALFNTYKSDFSPNQMLIPHWEVYTIHAFSWTCVFLWSKFYPGKTKTFHSFLRLLDICSHIMAALQYCWLDSWTSGKVWTYADEDWLLTLFLIFCKSAVRNVGHPEMQCKSYN